MNKDKETFETWNNMAALYLGKFMALDVYNDTYDYICSAIDTPNACLLEIGCGPGNITKYLLSKRPDFDIFGIDIAPNMIALAKQNNPTARFAVMDCRQIGDLHTKYDGIIGGFCLPYVSHTESHALLSTAHDLLNGHGLLYLSFVDGNPEQSEFKMGAGGRVYFYYHSLDNIKTQLKRLNFEDIQTSNVKYYKSETEYDIHTILTAKKK